MNKLALANFLEAIKHDWHFMAREDQLVDMEGGKPIELKMSGRGGGKTWTGANFIIEACKRFEIVHLVGPTAAAVRDVMVEGDSGILKLAPRWNRPEYVKSQSLLKFKNGSKALCFSGEKPDRLRGPQCYAGWIDEIAAFQYPQETFDNYMMGARLGPFPKTVITTTPRRIPLIKDLVKDKKMVKVDTVSTFANLKNLAPSFIEYLKHKYEGTTLGRQELYAELLSDVEGALWQLSIIDRTRTNYNPAFISELIINAEIAIAIDPASTSNEESDETGIIVGARYNGLCYILEDLSGKYSPNEMASIVVNAYHNYKATTVIYETNQGGDFIPAQIHSLDSSIYCVGVHAKKGKVLRAEPVVSKYEQRKVSHVGILPTLEDEMTTWEPRISDFSPNRVDALVYLVHWALINQQFIAI